VLRVIFPELLTSGQSRTFSAVYWFMGHFVVVVGTYDEPGNKQREKLFLLQI
jgi:hypothetical protein